MSKNPSYSFIDKIFLVFIFLIPLIPRPTIENTAKFLAPLSIAILVLIFIIWFLTQNALTFSKNTKIGLLIFILYIITLIYTLRIIGNEEWDELPYYFSRIMSYLLLFVLLFWIIVRRISIRVIYKSVFFGFLLLSIFVIFIGFTGISFFGELRPPRVYGIQMPFYKTIAIPRSYGEFGIIASASWSYFLIYKNEYNKTLIKIFAIILLLSITISQSRSTYLAIILVTIYYYICNNTNMSKKLLTLFILPIFILPILIYILILFDFRIIDIFIGEGIYEKNVLARFLINNIVINFIKQNPINLLIGDHHNSWVEFFYEIEGAEIGIHNHFLSNLIFIGLIGGFLHILIYILPIVNLIKRITTKERNILLVFLSSIGMISCLHFYEGFFSIIIILILSTLWSFYSRNYGVGKT